MSHYTQQEWIDFKQHSISGEKQLKMEQHLQTCDTCMDLWLGLITEAELDEAAVLVPENFSENTMKLVRTRVKPVSSLSSNMSKRRRLLAYYTAAAAITLMLVSGGVFQTVVHSLSYETAQQTSSIEGPTRLLYSWPAELNKTSSEYLQKIDLNNTLKGVKK